VSIRLSRLYLLTVSAALLAACNSTPAPADTVVPTVSITATPASLTSSGTVNVAVTAKDDVAIYKVELYDNAVKVGEDTEAPYTFTRSYGPSDTASHVLKALAYDVSNNTAEASATVGVDIKALTVSADQSLIDMAKPVKVTAVANPEAGRTISKVEFYDNGVLVATATAAPYTATINYTAAQNGPHIITAKSTDSTGAMKEATTTPILVALDASEPNGTVATARSVTIGTPVDGRISGQTRDEDYFSFTASAGDMLRLTVKSKSVFSDSTLDPYVEVLLPDGRTVLEKDDDSGVGLESDLRFNITTAGTYYIHVTSFKLFDDPAASDNLISNTYRMELSRR
jgi:Bacterial Ig domain/Bacterial pre-peptidase C-terminal domain